MRRPRKGPARSGRGVVIRERSAWCCADAAANSLEESSRMWPLLKPFRQRVEARHTPARRPRWYRPQCRPLEDRCLLSVTLTPEGPPVPLVGSPVTWTATVDDQGSAPVYQFSVGPAGGPIQVVQDFSPSNSFTWTPMQEGSYTIQVIVKESYSATTGEGTTASYTAESRVVGTSAVVSATSNPLVALFSAPPSPGSSMYVQFSPLGPNPSWTDTAPQPIVPGESTNFLVAGMLPNTTYQMRYVLDDGTASAPLEFTTGSLPADLTFPTFTQPQTPPSGSDSSSDLILHFGLGFGGPANMVETLATDQMGNIDWYYDPVANHFSGYATSLVPGGTVLMLGGTPIGDGYDTLREVDLAGDTVRETNINAVNAELAAMGQASIFNFNHDAQRLPNGD